MIALLFLTPSVETLERNKRRDVYSKTVYIRRITILEMDTLVCLVKVFWVLLSAHAAAQECSIITDSEIAQRIQNRFIPGTTTPVEIVQQKFNCLAVGVNTGKYRFATATVNVTSVSLQSLYIIFQVDVACVSDSGQPQWSNSIER